MNRIDQIFQTLRVQNRAALMPYITAGYPSLDVSAKAIVAMEQAGASIVEVGVPFSDPIADGPIIAHAMHEALVQGVTPRAVFDMIRSLRNKTQLGLIAMVSESIVMRMGEERFVADAAAAGIDGLIVPDIDTSDAGSLAELARRHDLSLSLLIAPTTSPQRILAITQLCSGFVYLLARAGITGERETVSEQAIAQRIAQIREATDLPIAVGFGISKPEHVAAVTGPAGADAAIVGSAIVRAMGEAARKHADPAEAAAALVRDLASGLRTQSAHV